MNFRKRVHYWYNAGLLPLELPEEKLKQLERLTQNMEHKKCYDFLHSMLKEGSDKDKIDTIKERKRIIRDRAFKSVKEEHMKRILKIYNIDFIMFNYKKELM